LVTDQLMVFFRVGVPVVKDCSDVSVEPTASVFKATIISHSEHGCSTFLLNFETFICL